MVTPERTPLAPGKAAADSAQRDGERPAGPACMVVIPTYEESHTIRAVLARLLDLPEQVEVVVVDDDSPDGTGKIVEVVAQRNPRVHVIHRRGKRGFGPALVAGFRYALAQGARTVAQMDGDLSHDPAVVLRFLERMERDGADLVLGTRYAGGGRAVNWPLVRHLLSRLGNLYARLVLGGGITDYTTGFTCIRAEALQRLDLERFSSIGFAFQIELKYLFRRLGLRLAEEPIVFVDRAAGRSKITPGIILEGLWQVWRVRWRGARLTRGSRPDPSR